VLQSLKDTDFENYDIEKDVQGLLRWLKDSGNFTSTFSENIDSVDDDLESIPDIVLDIINHFKQFGETNLGGLKMGCVDCSDIL
jgi:hypothetical protein